MGTKSLAQIRREIRNIEEPPKNPNRVKAGIKNGAVNKASIEGTTPEQAHKTIKKRNIAKSTNQLPKGGQNALNAIVLAEKRKDITTQTIQELKKANVLNLFIESSELVGKRLVMLALGQGSFAEAPASVQRLAMVDVLTYAGITLESAQQQSKPVHEMNRAELEAFIENTKAVIAKHENDTQGRVIEGDTLNAGES